HAAVLHPRLRFVGGFGEAEIVGAGEVLPRAVDLPRGEQLFRADDPELGAELGSDQVLAPFPAIEGEIGGLHTVAARNQREQGYSRRRGGRRSTARACWRRGASTPPPTPRRRRCRAG